MVVTGAIIRARIALLQPSVTGAVLFSLRTTLASLVALGLAFWMELGQPQWAAMTVWIVAQGSRGMSLSKGRWRIIGTMGGVLAAFGLIGAFPQTPWLFFPALALFAGLCVALAGLVQNFRGYALVLTGFTCGLVTLGSVEDPGHIFDIAVARGTYIALGVVCEMVVGMIFLPNTARQAREELLEKMRTLLVRSCHALAAIIRQKEDGVDALCDILGSLQSLNDQLEFIRIDAKGEDRNRVQRAYATLALLAIVLSRGVGLRSRIASIGKMPDCLGREMGCYARALDDMARTCRDRDFAEIEEEGRNLREKCRQSLWNGLSGEDNGATFQGGIVLTGIETMLGDLCKVLHSCLSGIRGIEFPEKYYLHRRPDWRRGLYNGLRTAAGILLAALVWEVSAWSYGSLYLSYVVVSCTIFSNSRNNVQDSRQFFYGAVWAVLVSIIPVFFIIPALSGYLALVMVLGFFMFPGGVCLRYPPFAAIAASCVNFFPWLLGLGNQQRMSELQWFNLSLALVLGLWSGVVAFRVILPFTFRQTLASLQKTLRGNLKRLNRADPAGSAQERYMQYVWVDDTTQRMEQILGLGNQLTEAEKEMMVNGTLSVMTIGRNIIMLRQLANAGAVPDDLLAEAELCLHHLVRPDSQKTCTAKTGNNVPVPDAAQAKAALAARFMQVTAPAQRRDLAQIAGCLMILYHEYPVSHAFLTQSRLMTGQAI